MFAVAYNWLLANLKKDEGQTMAEYGIILAVVAVVAVGAFAALETGIAGTITSVVSNL
jgi:Flp pilus assembly pilin Flp